MKFHRIFHRIVTATMVLVWLGHSSLVLAQLPDAGALQQDLRQQLPAPSAAPLPEAVLPDHLTPSTAKEGQVTFIVKGFVVEGVKSVPQEKIEEALADWVDQRISFSDLQKACDEVMDLYRAEGYIVQAIVPPQRVVDGKVKILVTEAKFGKLNVDTPEGPITFSKEKAAEYVLHFNPYGEILDNDNLEMALMILNEVPGLIAKSELERGSGSGDVDVKLSLTQPTEMWNAKLEANNYGSRTTGANQGVVSTDILQPFGIGDILGVAGIFAQGSQYGQISYSLPVMPNGLRFGLNSTYLNYRNVSNYVYNGNYGTAVTQGVNLAYPILRNPKENVNATLNYDYKTYLNNNISDNTIASQYTIRNLYAGLTGNRADNFFGGGISAGSVTVTYGQLGISSTSPSTYSTINGVQYTPSTFSKFNFNLTRDQQLANGGETTLFLSLQGQFASGNLNSAEQFYLGGPYAVRAYPVAQSPGAQGGLGTIELRHSFAETLQANIFFDGGLVQQYKNPNTYLALKGLTNAANTYSLMGAGFGVKWEYEKWNFGGMVAWKVGSNPLYSSTGTAVNVESTNTSPRAWLTASYRL
jgi:hemolysin activation/secretion protein